MFQRGDIVAVPFPFTDLTDSKLRPALVISNESIENTGDIIIVMITSQVKADGVNIVIDPNETTIVLPKNSCVRCHRIATIDRNIISKKVSEAKPQLLKKVIEAIEGIISDITVYKPAS